MKILVTGGCGFIGSHLVRKLQEANLYVPGLPAPQVRVLDNLSNGKIENLAGLNYDFIKGDLRNIEDCHKACEDVDIVYHQAAISSVPYSIKHPHETFNVNVGGTHNLFLAAYIAGVKKIVFASSAAVYGDPSEGPQHEDSLLKPKSPYAAHKSSCEQLAFAFNNLGLDIVSLRYFNVYGPNQGSSAVISKFISNALNNNSTTIHGDGHQTRDFIHVDDVVKANLFASIGPNGIFNVASGVQTSIKDIFYIINDIVGTETPPLYSDSRVGDVYNSLANIDKAKTILKWEPKISLRAGLQSTINKEK